MLEGLGRGRVRGWITRRGEGCATGRVESSDDGTSR